ncbi:MAG: low molecular weight protein arginine phosphatase [Promethearchaeia archaeon]
MSKKIRNVLFLCMGNTCRSPCAEYISKGLKTGKYKEELKDVEFNSAGFFNYFDGAQPETKEFIESKGIDMSDFESKLVNKELLEKVDLIIGMQKRHKRRLLRKFKDVEGLEEKTHILKEFAGETEDIDIEDPFQKDKETYFKILNSVEKYTIKAIEKVMDMN